MFDQWRWVIIAPEAEINKWTAAFLVLNPQLFLEVGPQVKDPETVDVLLLWNHPKGCLTPFTNVKVYYSLGAGVDHLLSDDSIYNSIPICRIVDPLLSFSMTNYILFAVLYYQRRWDKYLADRQRKHWDHDAPSEEKITIGVLGLGSLGSDAAKKLKDLGFEVIGYSPSRKEIPRIKTYEEGELETFLKRCNVLVCTVPYTDKTHGLLSMSLFRKLPPKTYLINVSRGHVQVEEDILKALESNYLSGAFLDVFEREPLPTSSPLWEHPKVQITPHIASITNPQAGVKQICENIIKLQNGDLPDFRVNPSKGY